MAILIRGGRGHIERTLLNRPTPLAERLNAAARIELPARAALVTPDLERLLGLSAKTDLFPVGHKLRLEWERERRAAVSRAALLWDRVLAGPTRTLSDVVDQNLELWIGLFDIRAALMHSARPMPPPTYAQILSDHAEFIVSTLERMPIDAIREEVITKVTARLNRRHAHWMARAYATDQQIRADASAKDSSNASTPGPMFRGIAVSAKTIGWRKRRLSLYRKQQSLTAPDLGRRLRMDPSVIRAIVREDWGSHKVNETNRSTLLDALETNLKEWYAPR